MNYKLKCDNVIRKMPVMGTWDWVESFYKNYDSSDTILLSNDLSALKDGVMEASHFAELHDCTVPSPWEIECGDALLKRTCIFEANDHFIQGLLSGEIIIVN